MKILAHAPTRISLFGGGTDLPIFYKQYGGLVINMSINLRQHIEIDFGKDTNIDIYPKGASPDFYRAFLEDFDAKGEVRSDFDAVIESGLGSSASAAVAMVAAIARAKGLYMNKRELAEKAWDIEVNKLGLYGGKQDQYAASYGGMSVVWFTRDGVSAKTIFPQEADFLAKHILLFYTGKNRKSAKIQENLASLDSEKIRSLSEIKRIASFARKYIEAPDIIRLGDLLRESWNQKKSSNKDVSTKEIDDLVEAGISAGAEGGKIMGSGGGGFMFFICKPELQTRVITQMEAVGCKHYDFSIDYNGVEVRKL
jgi:D-glycero-alpha-D-manno-heptose-7-phosphate kinase